MQLLNFFFQVLPLHQSEKKNAANYWVAVTKGKNNAPVLILFNPSHQEALEVLINHRDQFCPPGNPYLFHACVGQNFISGSKTLRKWVDKIPGLKEPKLITCGRLRKTFAVSMSTLNLGTDESQWLCQAFSHSSRVHFRDYSKVPKTSMAATYSIFLDLFRKNMLQKFRGMGLGEVIEEVGDGKLKKFFF